MYRDLHLVILAERARVTGGHSASLQFQDDLIEIVMGGDNTMSAAYKVVSVTLSKMHLRIEGSDELHAVLREVLSKQFPAKDVKGVALLNAVMEYVITELGWERWLLCCTAGTALVRGIGFEEGQRHARQQLNKWLRGEGIDRHD